jgi:hypothetical protein
MMAGCRRSSSDLSACPRPLEIRLDFLAASLWMSQQASLSDVGDSSTVWRLPMIYSELISSPSTKKRVFYSPMFTEGYAVKPGRKYLHN